MYIRGTLPDSRHPSSVRIGSVDVPVWVFVAVGIAAIALTAIIVVVVLRLRRRKAETQDHGAAFNAALAPGVL